MSWGEGGGQNRSGDRDRETHGGEGPSLIGAICPRTGYWVVLLQCCSGVGVGARWDSVGQHGLGTVRKRQGEAAGWELV